jgi:hypothetical protein
MGSIQPLEHVFDNCQYMKFVCSISIISARNFTHSISLETISFQGNFSDIFCFLIKINCIFLVKGSVFPHSINQKLTVTHDISHEITKSSHFLNISVGECVFCTQKPTRDPFTNKAQFSLCEKRVQGLATLFLATGITCLIWHSLPLYFFSKGVNSFFSQNPNLFHKLRKLLWD